MHLFSVEDENAGDAHDAPLKDCQGRLPPKEMGQTERYQGIVVSGPQTHYRELQVVTLHQAVPFVGFGMMNNSILILAGEAIDMNLGVTLGMFMICAVAIGNFRANLVRRKVHEE